MPALEANTPPKSIPCVRTTIEKKDGEYQIRAYGPQGQRLPEADCFESDKRAAEDTAAAMLTNVLKTIELTVAGSNQDCVADAVSLANELIDGNDGNRLITLDAALLAAAIIEGVKANAVNYDEWAARPAMYQAIVEGIMMAERWK